MAKRTCCLAIALFATLLLGGCDGGMATVDPPAPMPDSDVTPPVHSVVPDLFPEASPPQPPAHSVVEDLSPVDYEPPENRVLVGGSCFTAGTQVLMADGSVRPIEAVRPGERVRGRDGSVNGVTGVERVRLGDRLLYGFDGGPPFVTAEHPFLTAQGWKAIDPRSTRRESPHLAVGALAPGDRLAVAAVPAALAAETASGALAVRYAPAPLPRYGFRAAVRITAVRAAPGTVLYNLLLDGDHSYIANGYVVHNKDGGSN
jgi:hypothetical protein